ncbi:uncharacterized protein LOC132259433 [Phlebotomus argentipes]|uniref:uncharacterized protein LOC132259433 n=1 Tax=Phlebotomus argentipes TaxID=94469 RepID=UPI002892E826|nr:uncharacterized protein LOC132259433 [Phlebotomus argentipes]
MSIVGEKKFSKSRYIISPEGILKLIGIVLIVAGALIHHFYTALAGLLFPITAAATGAGCLLLYLMFATGAVKCALRCFNITDTVCTMMFCITLLSVSIVTITSDDVRVPSEYLPSVLAIVGSICLATSASIFFIRLSLEKETVLDENDDQASTVTPTTTLRPRKSVLI